VYLTRPWYLILRKYMSGRSIIMRMGVPVPGTRSHCSTPKCKAPAVSTDDFSNSFCACPYLDGNTTGHYRKCQGKLLNSAQYRCKTALYSARRLRGLGGEEQGFPPVIHVMAQAWTSRALCWPATVSLVNHNIGASHSEGANRTPPSVGLRGCASPLLEPE
jgi:hypothetical protein